MTKIINIGEVKEDRINKKILQDINAIILVLETSQQALSFFKKYKPIQEIISVIHTNLTLFKIKKSQHEKQIHPDK